MRDVVLLTIDCFRHDAVSRMSNLQSVIEDRDRTVRTDAIAPSTSTPWVSPALFQSRLFSDVLYDDRGLAHTRYSVDRSVPSLPERLSEVGYSTGAFVAGNPYLRQYRDHFDEYWDGVDEDRYAGLTGKARIWCSRVDRTLRLEKSVPAWEIARLASDWYDETDGPRFLWMHLMEPHFPYYPGLRRGREVGLLRSYEAAVQHFQTFGDADALSSRDAATLRDLYWQCIDRVDEFLPELLSIADDDDLVVVTGDHGEALHHGWINHVDLYDETVRVPLIWLDPDGGEVPDRPIRQLDVPAAILEDLGLAVPDDWDGVGRTADPPLEAVLLTLSPKLDDSIVSVGLRTDDRKLIRRYDLNAEAYVDSKLYDLTMDPEERRDRFGEADTRTLVSRLNTYVEEYDLLGNMRRLLAEGTARADEDGIDEGDEDRLRELGYVSD